MHTVSVVIAALNSQDTLSEQLEAIGGQAPHEIVVADNGSTDDTAQVARRTDGVITVDASQRRGAAHARNVGAAVATGDYLLFLDADDVVADGYLVAMSRALDVHKLVTARLDHRRLNPDWTIRYYGEPQRDSLPDAGFRPYGWGGALGVHADVHRAIDGFDETFATNAGEDNDYCWRAVEHGAEVHLVDDAVLYYRHRQRLGDIYRQSRAYARQAVQLHERWGEAGMPAPPVTTTGDLLKLAIRSPVILRSRGDRAAWVRSLGWRVGARRA